MTYTLMYRGYSVGTVAFAPAALPPWLGATASASREVVTGWLQVTDAYASVRAELSGMMGVPAEYEGLRPEAIRDGLQERHARYEANGLELRDAAGERVPCHHISVIDIASLDEALPEHPMIIVSAVLQRAAT